MNTAVEQRQVAVRCLETDDPEEMTEELLKGPYFGDERDHGHTNVRILKKLCLARGNDASNAGTNLQVPLDGIYSEIEEEAVGTTAHVRRWLCLKDKVDIVKQSKASYDRDVQDKDAHLGVNYANP